MIRYGWIQLIEMEEIICSYHEADKVVQFVKTFLHKTSHTHKRKASWKHDFSPNKIHSRSRSRSCSSSYSGSSSSVLTQNTDSLLQDMLDDAIDKREEIAVQFFKKLHSSMPKGSLPNMIKDLCCFYDTRKQGWASRMKADFLC